MADDKTDPLVQSLMALAVSAAPLIKRARDSGMFKAGTREEAASATVVDVPPTPDAEAVDYAAQKAALQDIIVNQAMKIAALEADVARLTTASTSASPIDRGAPGRGSSVSPSTLMPACQAPKISASARSTRTPEPASSSGLRRNR